MLSRSWSAKAGCLSRVHADMCAVFYISLRIAISTVAGSRNMESSRSSPCRGIGTLSEKSLHAGLKDWYASPGDQVEVEVDGFIIDIVRDGHLVEIQLRNLASIRRKLTRLLENHSLSLVCPVAHQKWIVRQRAGSLISRRRSPKRGMVVDIFAELVYIPHLLLHPNLTIEVVLIREEEILEDDGKGSWRRKRWSVYDRRLLEVLDKISLETPEDFIGLLPSGLSMPFTNRELSEELKRTRSLAQKMTYTLMKMDLICVAGKRKKSRLYQLAQ